MFEMILSALLGFHLCWPVLRHGLNRRNVSWGDLALCWSAVCLECLIIISAKWPNEVRVYWFAGALPAVAWLLLQSIRKLSVRMEGK